MDYNAKCGKCGYVFKTDGDGETCICPLCSTEQKTTEAKGRFKSIKTTAGYKKKTLPRLALEWAVFAAAFIAFIIILYILFSFLAGK